MKKDELTIVICCAGMGTRLGIGTTKALVSVVGKPLIIRQLEMLKDYDDVRIVVGFQAEKVIECVNAYRKDVAFVFNYEYATTGVAASFSKGLLGAREYVVVMDGDVLVHPDDLGKMLMDNTVCVGGAVPNSDETVYLKTDNMKVIDIISKSTECEWAGIAKLRTEQLIKGSDRVVDMIKPLLPLPLCMLRTREIDTPDDYERMVEWVSKGYTD